VVVDRPGALRDACSQHGISVVVAQELKPATGPLRKISATPTPGLITQFEAFNADLIHVHAPPAAGRVIPAANLIRIPCLFSLHARIIADSKGIRHPLIEARRAGLRFAVISVTKAIFEDLRKRDSLATDLYYVPLGIKAVSPSANYQKSNQPHRPNLIFAGTLDRNKGLDIAILAMADLRRRRGGRDCPVLNVYGSEGGEGDYLREMVTVLGMNDIVRFHGFQAGILEDCSNANILVIPSRAETGPLVVLEAMSRGIPAVAFDVGDVAEMLPNARYGRIISVNSIIAFTNAIESLLSDIDSGRFEPGLLIGRYRSLYTSEKMAERTEAVYRQVLESSSASA